ncbi:hypothetical protein ABZX51_007597 [Aspergillus tubingensis]
MAEMYSGLHVGQRFSSLEEFKGLVRSISVRQHWELRVTRSNKKSVVIGCRSSNNCYFRVVCRANKNATYISSLQDSHSCRRNATSTSKTPARSEASHVRFLLTEIPKLFDMKNKIRAQDVVDAVKRYHGYDISMRQAQRALIRLQQHEAQKQSEGTNTHDSSGDDRQDSQPPPLESQAESSTFGSLSSQRWITDTLQTTIMENIPQDEVHRDQAISASQLHSQPVHPPPQVHHQVQPTQQAPPAEVLSPEQTPLGHSLHHPASSQQSPYSVPAPDPAPPSDAGRPKNPTQPRPNDGQLTSPPFVLTNFKIEFTCATCGAPNQSFFPNHGNVTGGHYAPQHTVPSQGATSASAGPSIQSIQNSDGSSRAGGGPAFEGTSVASTRGVQQPWTARTMEVPLTHAHP